MREGVMYKHTSGIYNHCRLLQAGLQCAFRRLLAFLLLLLLFLSIFYGVVYWNCFIPKLYEWAPRQPQFYNDSLISSMGSSVVVTSSACTAFSLDWTFLDFLTFWNIVSPDIVSREGIDRVLVELVIEESLIVKKIWYCLFGRTLYSTQPPSIRMVNTKRRSTRMISKRIRVYVLSKPDVTDRVFAVGRSFKNGVIYIVRRSL